MLTEFFTEFPPEILSKFIQSSLVNFSLSVSGIAFQQLLPEFLQKFSQIRFHLKSFLIFLLDFLAGFHPLFLLGLHLEVFRVPPWISLIFPTVIIPRTPRCPIFFRISPEISPIDISGVIPGNIPRKTPGKSMWETSSGNNPETKICENQSQKDHCKISYKQLRQKGWKKLWLKSREELHQI